VTDPWDPVSVEMHPSDQDIHPRSAWESLVSAPAPTGVPSAAPPPTDRWEYIDPRAYSNPYTDAPVYTSGPRPPTTMPPPIAAAAPTVAGSMGTATKDLRPGTPGVPSDLGPDPLLSANYQPDKGELHIKERRSWKTWQLLTAVVIAAACGMWINGNSGPASGINGASSTSGGYKLPPASGSTSTSVAGAAGARGAATTTTSAGGSTAQTAGNTTTTSSTTPVIVGPATVLVPATQQTGNWTSPAFTIAGGTWNIGWAFQCAPAPTGGPSFQIFAVSNGGSPGSNPAVTSTVASGQAVTPLTSTGSQQIVVQTTAACRWVVKVTGSSS